MFVLKRNITGLSFLTEITKSGAKKQYICQKTKYKQENFTIIVNTRLKASSNSIETFFFYFHSLYNTNR